MAKVARSPLFTDHGLVVCMTLVVVAMLGALGKLSPPNVPGWVLPALLIAPLVIAAGYAPSILGIARAYVGLPVPPDPVTPTPGAPQGEPTSRVRAIKSTNPPPDAPSDPQGFARVGTMVAVLAMVLGFGAAPLALHGCASTPPSTVAAEAVQVTHVAACFVCAHTTSSGGIVLAVDGGTVVVPDASGE